MKGSNENNSAYTYGQLKYVKSKELSKKLICYIIAIYSFLVKEGGDTAFRASSIARALKLEVQELRNFFQELGMHYDLGKEGEGEAGDIFVSTVKVRKDEVSKKDKIERRILSGIEEENKVN